MGKHFLTLADSEVERDVNGEKAVTWLIQASRQGNDEATKLLQKCQKTKTGKGDNYHRCRYNPDISKIMMCL